MIMDKTVKERHINGINNLLWFSGVVQLSGGELTTMWRFQWLPLLASLKRSMTGAALFNDGRYEDLVTRYPYKQDVA